MKELAASLACVAAGVMGLSKVSEAFVGAPSARGALRGRAATEAAAGQASGLGGQQGASALAGSALPILTVGAATAVAAAGHRRRRRIANNVAAGDAVPDISLDLGFPPEKFNLKEFCKGKKVPGYLAKEDELKAKGISDVLVFCVNDGAVMTAWGKDQGVDDSYITMLGDPRSELTKAFDLVLDHPGPMSVLGNERCKRFSMFIDDGVIKKVNVAAYEDDPAGDAKPDVTLVEQMLEDL